MVTAVTVATSAPLSQIAQRLFELKKNAAEANGYLVEIRSGFATVAADYGADEKSIMTMTGHKTTQMVRRYIKESNLFKNNPLNKINL